MRRIETRMSRRIMAGMLCISLLSACVHKSELAAEYNDSIIGLQEKIVDAIDNLDSTLNKSELTATQLDLAMTALKVDIAHSLLALDSIGSFEKDPSLKVAAQELFGQYQSFANTEYVELVRISKLPLDSINNVVVDTTIELKQRINTLAKMAQDKFMFAQIEFGKKHHLEFE
jgi:hypothetical protein